MANPRRGEIDATFDGRTYTLCLTLGALAELENAFGDADMLALAERFTSGRLKAGDALKIIGAGLRGGGHDVSDGMVAALPVDGGAAGYVAIVARLLEATFGAASSAPAPSPAAPSATMPAAGRDTGDSAGAEAVGEVRRRDPFPGMR